MKIMIPSEKAKILDENIEFNKENNSLVIGNNLEVDGKLQLNGEIIVDGKVKELTDYYDVDNMFDAPLTTTIKDVMLKALGITSFPSFSTTSVDGIFKINGALYFGSLKVNNYGVEQFRFNLYNIETGTYVSDELLQTNVQNIEIGNIIYTNESTSFYKFYYEVDWHNNGIYPKKEIKGLLLSLNKVLIDVNTGLVLELVKYSDNEIKLMTKENIYDDTTCYLTEYIFKTIVGDEENYSLTIHDDLSIAVEHP